LACFFGVFGDFVFKPLKRTLDHPCKRLWSMPPTSSSSATNLSARAMDPKRSKLATLKNLPAAANAFAAGAVAKASGQNGLFVPDGQTTAPASSAGSSRASTAMEPVPPPPRAPPPASRGAELARLLSAIGTDLHAPAADVALVLRGTRSCRSRARCRTGRNSRVTRSRCTAWLGVFNRGLYLF